MMPDMEKVISALDCRVNDTDLDCRKCDYYIREDKIPYCDFRSMLRDALALLKEQEAKTVIKIEKRFNDCDLTGYCPFCSRPLIKDWAENYCGYCGKPVLWEGR